MGISLIADVQVYARDLQDLQHSAIIILHCTILSQNEPLCICSIYTAFMYILGVYKCIHAYFDEN